jgi:hypothetical protein
MSMEQSRKQFEAWVTKSPFEKNIARQTDCGAFPGNYRDYAVELAWCAWFDAQNAEREACAKLVETLNPCMRGDCDLLAEAIRARGNK